MEAMIDEDGSTKNEVSGFRIDYDTVSGMAKRIGKRTEMTSTNSLNINGWTPD